MKPLLEGIIPGDESYFVAQAKEIIFSPEVFDDMQGAMPLANMMTNEGEKGRDILCCSLPFQT